MNLDARTLAVALAAADDAALSQLFAARDVAPGAPWRDFFDAAEALLEPVSVARGLAATALDDAVRLLSSAPSPTLIAAALTTADGAPYDRVRQALSELPEPPEPQTTLVPTAAPASAAERAFVTVGALADLLVSILRTPLQRIGSGAVGATDRRRLAETGIVDHPEDVDLLIEIAHTAGLVRPLERQWRAEHSSVIWLQSTTAVRWAALATAFRAALPDALRTTSGGWISPAAWTSAYPWNAAWPERAAGLLRQASVLGIVDGDIMNGDMLLTSWAAALARGADADTTTLLELLPHEVDRVFLQNDLTAIAPGPLAPDLDLRLRTMAVRESHAQASTYRFTASTLASAITEGESAESIRAFLTSLSLTGVPQPLDYLIGDVAGKHGLVRVSQGDDGRARIVADRAYLERIQVDQALRHLGITRAESRLIARAGRDVTCWALADAHYPAIAVDDDDRPVTVHRHDVAPAEHSTAPVYTDLIATLRAASGRGDTDAAWLERELDAAVRAKAVVDIVVRMPDGTERSFTVEAAGIGGGRLRGRDRAADVERTLPISMIVSVSAGAIGPGSGDAA